jgi:hypothetical protein
MGDEIDLIARRDKVEGGKDGKINIQASQLASRTAFLKGQLDSLAVRRRKASKRRPILSGAVSCHRPGKRLSTVICAWSGRGFQNRTARIHPGEHWRRRAGCLGVHL